MNGEAKLRDSAQGMSITKLIKIIKKNKNSKITEDDKHHR